MCLAPPGVLKKKIAAALFVAWFLALSELCTPETKYRSPHGATPCRQHGQPHELCGCGLPSLVPHGGQLENCRSRQPCLCHPPLITCMRQAREQNSGVVRATDEPAEQQMQQRWERSATALTMPRGSEASFTFVGTHRDIVSSHILHRSLLLCRSPLIICV